MRGGSGGECKSVAVSSRECWVMQDEVKRSMRPRSKGRKSVTDSPSKASSLSNHSPLGYATHSHDSMTHFMHSNSEKFEWVDDLVEDGN